MARRGIIIGLLVFLFASIPILFYFWARSNGQPVPIPALNPVNQLLPGALQLRPAVEVASLDETLLADPFSGEPCFLDRSYTCLLGNESQEAGQLNISYNSSARPDTSFTLGLILADRGAMYRTFRNSLAQRSEPQPVYNALIEMAEYGNKQGVNPSMLWAYYDYLYMRAEELQISPAEVGLDGSGRVFIPEPQALATALATARQLFPEDQQAVREISEDDLSRKLNRTSLSQSGKAVIYVTAQLFGSEFAQQVFSQPQGFTNYYTQTLLAPSQQGNFALEFNTTSQTASEFYAADNSSNFIVCHNSVPYACTVNEGQENDPSIVRAATCDQVEFLQYFCSTKQLVEVL